MPFPVYRNATAGTSTGMHPPRSRPPISHDEFMRRLKAADTDFLEALEVVIDRLAQADRRPADWYRLGARLRAAREEAQELRNG